MVTTAFQLHPTETGKVLLRNISWGTYSALLEEIGDMPVRLAYDHGLLEIEVPSLQHEQLKKFVGAITEACLEQRRTDFEPCGSATWRKQDELRGVESDECYYIQHAAMVKGRQKLDLTTDPPPDLAIEIDITSSSVDKMSIYMTLLVPEIWRLKADGSVEMFQRRADRSYQPIQSSVCIPELNCESITRYVKLREQLGYSEAVRRFKADLAIDSNAR